MSTGSPGAHEASEVLAVLFAELIDDAALFPPGDAPMTAAVPAHLRADAGPHSSFLGRFLCPVSKLDELRATLGEDDDLRLGLIADTGLDGLVAAFGVLEDDDRFILEAAEIRHPGERLEELAASLPYGVEAYVEIAPGADPEPLIATLAGREAMHAKLRTGGLAADAFPSPGQVAEFLAAAAGLGVGVKCTAGLHNAVRHTDAETGFTHHGFLNVLLAASLAADSGDTETVEAVLDSTDAALIAESIRDLTVEEAAQTRDFFHGFGSCSFTEPLDDLRALDLLPTLEG
jgi:hypothetical protein